MAVFVLFAVAAFLHFLGAILALVWYLNAIAETEKWCEENASEDHEGDEDWCQAHKDTVIGWIGLILIPIIAIALISSTLEVIAACYAFKAKGALQKVAPGAAT